MEWVGNENKECLEFDEDNQLTGTQGAYFMDSPRTAVARYEQVNTQYYLTLLSYPDYLAIIDPSILIGKDSTAPARLPLTLNPWSLTGIR